MVSELPEMLRSRVHGALGEGARPWGWGCSGKDGEPDVPLGEASETEGRQRAWADGGL